MTLAERRHHYQRMKAKFYRKNRLMHWWPHNEANAAVYAKHGKVCSCFMCGNPRRKFDEPTPQEIRHQDSARDQIQAYT